MKQTHVGTLTGSAEVALTAVATDRIHTGLHVTLTSQQNDSVGVQVLLKRGADQYRLHRVEELGAKDSVSFPLAHTLAAADQLVLKQSGTGKVDYVAGWIDQAATTGDVRTAIGELKDGVATSLTAVTEAVTAAKDAILTVEAALDPAEAAARSGSLTTDFTLTRSFQDVLSVSLTPSSASAKVRLWLTLFWAGEVEYRILRGADAIIPTQGARRHESATADEPISFPISDAPAAGTAQTYTLQAQTRSGTGTHSVSLGTTLFVEELKS